MRDLALLSFTLRAIRCLGEGKARLQQDGRAHHAWYAGSQPLNGQAVQDLSDDGWITISTDRRSLTLKDWPSFATRDAEEAPR